VRQDMEWGLATSYAALLPMQGAIQSLVHACDHGRYPQASAAERLITALTASNFAVRSVMLAERKAARGRAPVSIRMC